MAGSTLPDRVAQIYYTYGLFCSSHPITAITLALAVVLLCCYPLLNVPLPGNIPTTVTVPLNNDVVTNFDIVQSDSNSVDCKGECKNKDIYVVNLLKLFNETQKLSYIWTKDKPLFFVQQIVLKTAVNPWNKNLRMWDAFRAPIQEVFRILEIIRNHEEPQKNTTFVDHCYQIDSIKRRDSKESRDRVLPEYSCLLLSPANLWQQNIQTFSQDNNILGTIFSYQNLQKGKVSIAEIAIGMKLKEAGIKRYPLRSKPRVLQYAVTMFYRQPDVGFISSLDDKLRKIYPLHQSKDLHISEVNLIYFPGKFNFRELVPLSISFVGLFLYVYFSVRKIEFIKSKFGLAICAVVTIVGSLSMAMGVCFFFGFSLSLQGKEIFPYLIILVGLENVLVLTKSVTSTDSRLDFKIRLAQGLSKEGWSITKNLLTEITILTVSLFTFVPVIQEFSIFVIVSLICDYFMQMLFFATVLGIDVCHIEYLQDQNNRLQLKDYFVSSTALNWRYNNKNTEEQCISPQRMIKSKSHPKLNGMLQNTPTDVIAKRTNSTVKHNPKVPKRIRLFNMWARTRFFQRAFMAWMVVWVSMIVYNSGIIEHFTEPSNVGNNDLNNIYNDENKTTDSNEYSQHLYNFYNDNVTNNFKTFSPLLDNNNEKSSIDNNDTLSLKHSPHLRPWMRLSPYHWSTILSLYNESLAGRYIVILPPILLSCRISPELAVSIRNPEEKDPQPLRWQALAAALDPIDIITDFELIDNKAQHQWSKITSATEIPIYPTTPMEILLLAILCTISIGVIAYMMVVLYRCICSRNYAEWRASWNSEEEQLKTISKQQPAVQLLMEAVPLLVSGHNHEVECLVTDGEKIVSSCLQGTVKVWDSQNGEILMKIDRYAYFKFQKEMYEKINLKKSQIHHQNDNPDLDRSGHNPSEDILRNRRLSFYMNEVNFKSPSSSNASSPIQLSSAERTKYNFAKNYRDVFCTEADKKSFNLNDFEYKENHVDTIRNEIQNSVNYNNESLNGIFLNHSQDIPENKINDEEFLPNNVTSKNLPEFEVWRQKYDSMDVKMNSCWRKIPLSDSPVWSMDFSNDLIILGCADGRIEFWDASSPKLLCIWWNTCGEASSRGVTHVRALGGARRVCVATLSGHLLLLRLDAYNTSSGVHIDWRFSTAYRRTHKRTGSTGSLSTSYHGNATHPTLKENSLSQQKESEELHCVRLAHSRPHQQPITEMHSEGGRVLTGGQDHVLKVFSSTDLNPLFTLHGHCGPITSCFIDHATPTIGGSGSQDGLLCVWDLHTGACLYSIQAHDGAVTSLSYTASYVISAGADERLCIWDRFQGHMLNSLHIGLNYMSRMLPLTHTLLLMGDRGSLTVYDLSNGEIIRRVLLGQNDGCVFVRHILPLKDAVVCDYANQLRIVRFPLVSKLSMDTKND